jgi:predicted Zn-dependent protease
VDVRAFGDDKILFLTDRPLSLPVGPMGKGPVDGFAQYGGLKAVASAAGLGKAGKLGLADGLAKRAAQQVGHLFGLHHCHDARCLMLPGWAEGFDKNADTMLCPFCREKSEKRILGT